MKQLLKLKVRSKCDIYISNVYLLNNELLVMSLPTSFNEKNIKESMESEREATMTIHIPDFISDKPLPVRYFLCLNEIYPSITATATSRDVQVTYDWGGGFPVIRTLPKDKYLHIFCGLWSHYEYDRKTGECINDPNTGRFMIRREALNVEKPLLDDEFFQPKRNAKLDIEKPKTASFVPSFINHKTVIAACAVIAVGLGIANKECLSKYLKP